MGNTDWMGRVKPGIGRRDFLRVGSLSFLGISLRNYLMAAEGLVPKGKAKACIMLWLEGGPSQVDTWDPKLTSNSSFKPISTNVPGIQISELLPKMSRHMDKLAIIRSMHTQENNHPPATHYVITGHRPNPAMQFPSIGSIIAREMGPRDQIPPYVVTDRLDQERFFKAAYAGPEYEPMFLPNPSRPDFAVPDLSLPKSVSEQVIEDRLSALKLVDRMYREKVEEVGVRQDGPLHRGGVENAPVSQGERRLRHVQRAGEAQGRLRPQSVRTGHAAGATPSRGRRPLCDCGRVQDTSNGTPTPITTKATARLSRLPWTRPFRRCWKTLSNAACWNPPSSSRRASLAARPKSTPTDGRDHWPECWSLVLGGGGIRGGQVIGASDERAAYVADRMVTMGDVYATVYKAFGIDWEKTYMTPIGRPVKIANSIDDKTGVPIHELV